GSSAADPPTALNRGNNFVVLRPSATAKPGLSARNMPLTPPRDTTAPGRVPSARTPPPRARSGPCPQAVALAYMRPATPGGKPEPSPRSWHFLAPAPHYPRPDKHKASPTPPTPSLHRGG